MLCFREDVGRDFLGPLRPRPDPDTALSARPNSLCKRVAGRAGGEDERGLIDIDEAVALRPDLLDCVVPALRLFVPGDADDLLFEFWVIGRDDWDISAPIGVFRVQNGVARNTPQ